jgi:hypothetical protein
MKAIVVFADLLGFAALTEQHDVCEDDFEAHDRPETDEFLAASLEDSCALVQTYIRFQVAVQSAVTYAHAAGDRATSVTFSDSAFVATETFATAKTLAIALMTKLLPHGIMLRVGIAQGSFVAVRFRADVSLGSGEHSAQFLGSGVVRAYATAEKSRLKGARILIHPSAATTIESQSGRFFQPLPIGEDEQVNPVGVTHEISYLGRDDRDLYRGVQRAHRKAPATVLDHYEATYRAMNRMRALLNRPPMQFDAAAE